MKTTRQRKTATAVIILIAMLVQITGFGLFGPVRADTGTDLGDIFTDVEIKINDVAINSNDTTEIKIADDLTLKFTFNWEIDDSVDL